MFVGVETTAPVHAPAQSIRARIRAALVLDVSALRSIFFGALMLMAVTVLIGRPTVFSDTDDYYGQGHSVVRALERWAHKGKAPFDLSEAHYRLTNPDAADEEPEHNQDGARSVYYGVLLYATQAIGSLWLLAGVQALAAAALVRLLWRRVVPAAGEGRGWAGDRGYLLAMAALSLGSSLPVFTGFAMPDVFAGFAAMATVLAVVYGDSFGRWGKAALWLLLAACINFHGSNLPTTLGVTALGLFGLGLMKVDWRKLLFRAGFVLSAAVMALMAAKAYALVVRLRTGDELGRPPFLTARVLADGPGRAYLAHACGANPPPFQVCAFRRLPNNNTEDILWADEPELGIFNSSEYPVRLKLVHEDARFALAAVLYQPGQELVAAMKNWGAQLSSFDLGESLKDPGYYLADPYWKTTNLPKLIQGTGRCDPEQGTCAVRAPRNGLSQLFVLTAGLGLLAAAACVGGHLLARRGRDRKVDPKSDLGVWAASLLVLAVPINAAVCGMLSGPFARYQMRMLWLIPLAAMLLLAMARRARRG
jgi:hypothetical protein